MESEHTLTNEQLLLMEVRDKLCGGNAAELARRIGRAPSYVNRLFYPEGKDGRKGIGQSIQQAVLSAFPLPLTFWATEYPAIPDGAVARLKAEMVALPDSPEEQDQVREAVRQRLVLRRKLEARDAVARVLGPEYQMSVPGVWRPGVHHTTVDDDLPFELPAFLRSAEPRAAYGMEPILAWEHPDDLPDGEFVMVPRLDVKLSGGSGHEQVEIELVKENPQAFRTEWIRQQRLKPSKLAAMRASGESMEPTIYTGDSLLVDTSQTDIMDGRVYALWYDGGERVKRLFRLPGGGLRIKSDNTDHPLIELGADYHGQVRVIGRVVHRSGIGGL